MENVAIIISRPEEQWDKVYELLKLGGALGYIWPEVVLGRTDAPYLLFVKNDSIRYSLEYGDKYSGAVMMATILSNDFIEKIISAEEFLENPEIIDGWKRSITIDPQDSSTWPKYSLVWCWNHAAKTGRNLRVWNTCEKTFALSGRVVSLLVFEKYELYTGPVEPWMEEAIKICKELECEK